MSANKIIDEIRKDADGIAAAILREGEEKAAAACAAIAMETAKKVAEIERNAETDAQEELRRTMLIAELESRKSELGTKRGVIDQAYALALEKLAALSGEQWEKLITRLVVEHVETGEERLCVPQKDRAAYESGFLARLNATLVTVGKKGQLALDDRNAPFEHGVLLVSDIYEVNASFEMVVRDARESSEQDITRFLFPAEVS